MHWNTETPILLCISQVQENGHPLNLDVPLDKMAEKSFLQNAGMWTAVSIQTREKGQKLGLYLKCHGAQETCKKQIDSQRLLSRLGSDLIAQRSPGTKKHAEKVGVWLVRAERDILHTYCENLCFSYHRPLKKPLMNFQIYQKWIYRKGINKHKA